MANMKTMTLAISNDYSYDVLPSSRNARPCKISPYFASRIGIPCPAVQQAHSRFFSYGGLAWPALPGYPHGHRRGQSKMDEFETDTWLNLRLGPTILLQWNSSIGFTALSNSELRVKMQHSS